MINPRLVPPSKIFWMIIGWNITPVELVIRQNSLTVRILEARGP